MHFLFLLPASLFLTNKGIIFYCPFAGSLLKKVMLKVRPDVQEEHGKMGTKKTKETALITFLGKLAIGKPRDQSPSCEVGFFIAVCSFLLLVLKEFDSCCMIPLAKGLKKKPFS